MVNTEFAFQVAHPKPRSSAVQKHLPPILIGVSNVFARKAANSGSVFSFLHSVSIARLAF